MAIKYTRNANGDIVAKDYTDVLTQAQVDAQAVYAAASSIDPYQAAVIKKNANGNIMSPGVLQSLSALGVDANSGVGSSIANIDAMTRETRLANQKDIAQKRENAAFEKTPAGMFWRGVKVLSNQAMTFFGTTFAGLDAAYRSGSQMVTGAAKATALGAVGVNAPEYKVTSIPEQTVAGQVIAKSISDIKAGKTPDINFGKGFFPSEEVGVGHKARQASLDAAKIAIRDSKGKVIGYRPRTILGDTYANMFTLGNPESEAGQVISLVADIAGSFAFDPGIARASEIKRLNKLAAQARAKGAISDAAKIEAEKARLDEALLRAQESASALRKEADSLKGKNVDSAKQSVADARATWQGKNEDAIKAAQSVRVAQARLDDIAAVEAKSKEEIAILKSSIEDLKAVSKSPVTIARTESAIAKQSDELARMNAARDEAIRLGRIPMHSVEDIAKLETALEASKSKLDALKNLKYTGDIPVEDALAKATDALNAAKARVKEASVARKFSEAQVAERSMNVKRAAKMRELAAAETLKKTKAERTLSEKMSDAQLSLKDKRRAWEIDVANVSNVAASLERPGLAYQNIADFLTAGHGTVAVDRLVEMSDWKEIWRKSGGRLTHEMSRAIADARTPDEVVDAIAPYLLKGDVQQGVLRPGIISRAGERVTERTKFLAPGVRKLTGVGARVQARMAEHQKVAALFEGFYSGLKGQKNLVLKPLSRAYQTKIKGGAIINIHDREELLRSAEDFGKAAKLDQVELDKIIDEISNAASPAVAGYAASVKLMNAVFKKFEETIPVQYQDAFKQYTTAFKSSAEEMSSYWAREHISGAELKYMTLNGDSVVLPGAHLDSELLNSTIYMPPVSELLKLTGRLANYKSLSKGRDLADVAISDFWKKIQLVRPAYIIRNIAEEQIRVFGTGHISFFNNPGMALAMWLGREDGGTLRQILRQFDTYRHNIFDESFSTGDDAADLLNETIAHEMQNSYVDLMQADKFGAFDERAFKVLQFKNVGAVEYGSPRFFDGVANQLRILHSSEFAKVVAGFDPASVKQAIANGAFRDDAVVDYFLSGEGRKTLNNFASSMPDDFAAFIKTPDGLKKYLFKAVDPDTGRDISILARVTEMAGGNKSLKQLIAFGKVNVGGKTFRIPQAADTAKNSISNAAAMKAGKKALMDAQEAFAKELKETFTEAGNWDNVKVNVPSRNLAHIESKAEKGRFVTWFFDKATELEKNSTFGPEFRQAYWDAINEIATTLNADAKAKLLQVAENSLTTLQKSGKPVGDKHPVWNAFRAAKGDGPLSIEEAHTYADTYARNHVKGLFYNAQERRLLFHQLRLIAPFANAWEDTIRKWSSIVVENPLKIYEGVKVLEWMQKPESSAIYQMTDAQDFYNPNQGFFFNDPNSGQRMFWVPFTGTVLSKLSGVATGANYSGAPMAFSANPASFNFALGAGSILPGVGPGITVPLSAIGTFNNNFIDNLPMGIQKWIFPFGRTDFSAGFQSAILPGNWNKIIGGLTGIEQTYAANFKPVMSYLAAGGNYNLDNPDDQAELVRDTDTFSRWQSMMRGFVGLFSPVSLVQQGLGTDENGDVTTQVALFEDFQNILQNNDGDYNKAWFDFLNLYGAPQAFALISASSGNGPNNWDSYAFVVANPDVASKYKDVWGYVMPGGGLSTEMYQWNLIHDTKKKLSATEILAKVNNQRYYATRDALMTRVDAGEIDKSQYSTALQYLKDSMGGGPVVEFDPNKRGRVLTQLKNLTEDERFVDIPSVKALRDYMYLRDQALAGLGKTKFTGAASEQASRDWLAAQAQWVIQDNPDFQKMFYGFFANELEGK